MGITVHCCCLSWLTVTSSSSHRHRAPRRRLHRRPSASVVIGVAVTDIASSSRTTAIWAQGCFAALMPKFAPPAHPGQGRRLRAGPAPLRCPADRGCRFLGGGCGIACPPARQDAACHRIPAPSAPLGDAGCQDRVAGGRGPWTMGHWLGTTGQAGPEAAGCVAGLSACPPACLLHFYWVPEGGEGGTGSSGGLCLPAWLPVRPLGRGSSHGCLLRVSGGGPARNWRQGPGW